MNLNTVAQSILPSLPPILLDAGIKSVLVLGAAGLVAVCLKRGSAAARHLIWFLAVLALLALPVLSWCLPGWNILPRWLDARTAQKMEWRNEPPAGPVAPSPPQIAEARPPDKEMDLNRQEERGTGAMKDMVGEARTPAGLMTEAATPPPASFDYRRLASVAWVAGAGLAFLPVLLGCLSLRRLERKSRRETASTWLELLRQLMAQLGLKRNVALLKTAHRRMPMTWGFLRPRLLLPEESQAWPAERRRVVMLHELAHARRWDYLTNLLTQLACALYWFNPLVWLAARRMTTERERACDDIVLGQGAKPADYAQQILEIAAGLPLGRLAAYGGIPMARPSKLEGRLVAILDAKRNRAALTRLAVAAMLILLGLVVVPVAMMRAAGSSNQATAATNPPATAAQSLEFMPEIERVLPGTSALGERCYLDFEGGTVATERRAENPQLNRQLHRDLKADLTPGAEQWTGIGLQLTSATDELWNAPADQVIATLAEHLADAPPTLPVTRAAWLFKTADGNYGLMREEGMVQTPGGGRGMKIVYKLARAVKRPAPRNGAPAVWIVRPVKIAAKELPLPERIKLYVTGEPATTGYALEIWEQGPGSEMRLRDDLTRQRIPGGEVFYLKARNRFYIQWDGGGASTLHYYGPFAGDPVEVLGLAETNVTPMNGTNQVRRTGAANPSTNGAAAPASRTSPQNTPTVTVKAVDAKTQQPISDFTVTRGAPPDSDLLVWLGQQSQRAQNGAAQITIAGFAVVKVEAAGYRPEMASGWIEADTNWLVPLQKGGDYSGRVIGTDGKPAQGAQLTWQLRFAPLAVNDRRIVDARPASSPENQKSPIVTTDEKGGFAMTALPGIISLIVFHEQGFAEVPKEVLEDNLTIHLQPWDNNQETAAAAGFRVDLRADRLKWGAKEMPTLTAEIASTGGSRLESSTNTRLWRLEVDGKWYYRVSKGGLRDIETTTMWTNRKVALDGEWWQMVGELNGAAVPMFGQTMGWQIPGGTMQTNELASGKHTVRLAVFAAQPGTETIGAICAISNPVVIEIADGGEKPAWAESNGLRSRVILDEKVFRAGQSVPVHIEIENTSAEATSFTGPHAQHGISLMVMTSEGKEVRYIGGSPLDTVGPPNTLEPGHSAVFGPFNLADNYYLRIPGQYIVKWRGELTFGRSEVPPIVIRLPPSAEVRFEVVADPAATADGDPVGRLLPLLNDKWSLAAANSKPVRLQPGGNWGEVTGQYFYLNYYSGLNGTGIGYISLWLTGQPAIGQNMTNDSPPSSEYLGKLSRWQVYFNANSNAAKAWPAAREDIKRALSAEAIPQSGIQNWGEAVEGFKVRLRATEAAGDGTPRLLVDIANDGPNSFHSTTNDYVRQLEVDGRWFVDNHSRPRANAGTTGETGGALRELVPGQSWTNLLLVLSFKWRTAHSNELGTAIFGNGWSVPNEFRPEPLKLSPGKHTVRLAVVAEGRGPVRAVSQPLEIEIARPPGNERSAAANATNPPVNLVPANLPVFADIRGSVVDDETGAAVTDFWVQQGMANPDKPGEIIWSETYRGPIVTGSPGRFTVQAMQIGQPRRVLADGYLPEPVPEHPVASDMRPVNMVLRLKRGGEVHGVVLDSMARPVTGARVFLATEQTPTFTDGKPQNTFRGSSATTDARGHFTLSGVGATEPKVIAVSPDGFQICPAPKYRPGEELKVTLPKPATLTVRYDIADDAPEAQLHLMLRDSGPGISGMNEWNPKVANGGQIVLTNLAPGTYDFARSKAGVGFRYEHRRLVIEAGRTQNVDLVRTNGFPIHGEVTGLADTQAPGARIYIGSPEDTGSLRWEWHLPVFDVETCGKDGQFQTARLSPGNYTISVEAFEPEAPQFATNGGRRVQVVYSGLRLPTYTGTARVTVTAEAAPAPVRIELHPRTDAGARR